MDSLRDRLEITQASHNRIAEEKEITGKELERVLEKYDRYLMLIRAQGLSYTFKCTGSKSYSEPRPKFSAWELFSRLVPRSKDIIGQFSFLEHLILQT